MSIESRLNFSDIEPDNSSAIKLKNNKTLRYYSDAFNAYCTKNNIDTEENECSEIIMKDYASLCEDTEYWFWIDN